MSEDELETYSDQELLNELVDRGRIHENRLLKDHFIWLTRESWQMVHPLDCPLGGPSFRRTSESCPYHEVATKWERIPRIFWETFDGDPPTDAVFRMPEPEADSLEYHSEQGIPSYGIEDEGDSDE